MMKITVDHLNFWRERKAGQPAWFVQTSKRRIETSVHTLINQQVPESVRNWHDAHNMMVSLRLAEKRGEMVNVLVQMAMRPNISIRPERRAGYARKWIEKIRKAQGV